MRCADEEDGQRPGASAAESVQFRDARKTFRILEQENEILRRVAIYWGGWLAPKKMYPLIVGSAAQGIPIAR